MIELLVVFAIIGVLVALLIPAIFQVREASSRLSCQNNLRQIGIAVHHYVSATSVVPTEGNGPTGNGGPGNSASVFFQLLPYLEQDAVYNSIDGPGQDHVVGLFLCPSDGTGDGNPPIGAGTGTLALGSYNYNVAIANDPDSGVFPLMNTPASRLRLDQAMPDGASCTILAGEHVQWCGGLGGAGGGGGGGGPGGTNPWGTIANKRVFGGTSMGPLHKNIAVGVGRGQPCQTPPTPAAGVSWFSTGHPSSLNFLMGDCSVLVCARTSM